MRNLILSALSAGLLFASAPAVPASAAVGADINVHIGDTPRFYFARQPRTILIPDTRVYYVSGMSDYDMFQCDGWWYIDDGGYWYRARSYRGPFVNVSFQSVPNVIINVPGAYAHQPYRPGVWRRDSRYYNGGGTRLNTGYHSGNTWQNRGRQDNNWNNGDRGDRNDQGNWNNGHGNNGNNHGNRGRGRGHEKD